MRFAGACRLAPGRVNVGIGNKAKTYLRDILHAREAIIGFGGVFLLLVVALSTALCLLIVNEGGGGGGLVASGSQVFLALFDELGSQVTLKSCRKCGVGGARTHTHTTRANGVRKFVLT